MEPGAEARPSLFPSIHTLSQPQDEWLNAALRALPPSVVSGRQEIFLYAPLLQCWQAPELAPLRSRWVEEGLLVRGSGGELEPAFPFDDYPLVFKVGRLASVQAGRPGWQP